MIGSKNSYKGLQTKWIQKKAQKDKYINIIIMNTDIWIYDLQADFGYCFELSFSHHVTFLEISKKSRKKGIQGQKNLVVTCDSK